ncbi:SSL2 DNA or RNA helicases of superfamily II [uncultured Caudovirales phage]|uniref:SSL2 DNA or RNA helicases of superfamily II n=1 Tax=uncultured Caudovirales phage TaxID=2100421 RepID=A0A6J5P1K1_9CAUD|nr:SSL2 DNA or RNA helicases of superfamily II [uncultured Caudovirales phage]
MYDLFSPPPVAVVAQAMPLRDYQDEAKTETISGFAEAGKQLVVIPTGGGKTIFFAHLAKHFAPGKTLILAHREELLEQAKAKVLAATGLHAEIEKAERRASMSAVVVVGSVQTLTGRCERFPSDHFDLLVIDEAHHSLAESYLRILAHFTGAKILGVTATPDRGDKKNLGSVFERVAYEVTLARLIREGYLSPIKVRTLPVKIDLNGVKKMAGDLSADQLGAKIEPWLERVALAMSSECWDRKSIVFLPLVKTSERMAEILTKNGIEARSVSGYDDNRKETLDWFASAPPGSALCNAMLLTEGYDQPDVDCIVNLRPTAVRSLYTQMVGRGTRVVAKVDALPTAEARREAIAASSKSELLLLDFLWQSEKLSLMGAANLFADEIKDVKAIGEALANGGEGSEDQDVLALGDSIEEQRMKKVIAALKENHKKPAGTHDAVGMCLSLGAAELANYEPLSAREARPATTGQLATLEKLGFDPASITCFGHASAIMDKLSVRRLEGLATPKQVRMLARFRHPSPEMATFADASAFIGEQMSGRRVA